MPKMAKYVIIALLLVLCAGGHSLVPAHPMYQEIPDAWQATRIEALRNFTPNRNSSFENSDLSSGALQQANPTKNNEKTSALPQNILALMVQFSDVSFKAMPQAPDYLVHDRVFFERWMLHLQDFYTDASHGRYLMNYTVHPQVLTLPHSMSFYGNDTSEKIDKLLPQILTDLMPLCDQQIDFSQYQGLIIFHAGTGQESDIDGIRTNQIWSTFLTRKLLQSYYDPDNDSYPGFSTGDGAILTNVVIVSEDEFQDYFPPPESEDHDSYLFSIFGVLAHQFGHVLGLPTLFDNDSSNGKSQGIGNWGLMGTGVWNANGYVPAQLSAWCRYYLGWEDAVELHHSAEDLVIDHFLNHQEGAIRLYKLPISNTEYFLLENRQQNPDGSLDPYNGKPSYSFKLLPEDQQEYYESFPLRPFFNFMQNRYISCEWDFFLPGYGMNPDTDGSGILIWHIDENIIAQNFTTNFDKNRVNANARHKGIDLEEADGYQHLDTPVMNIYKWGSPNDSFRQGNNDYFGNETHQGLTWLPNASSYYGGIPLEVYDISDIANQMTFSVRFSWKLDCNFSGINTLPAAAVDFDGDGDTEIFYPMPDGVLNLFDNEVMAEGFPQYREPIPHLYTWDGDSFYIPMQTSNIVRLRKMNRHGSRYIMNLMDYSWDSHPVDVGDALILPLKQLGSNNTDLYRLQKTDNNLELITTLPDTLSANLSYVRNSSGNWTQNYLYAVFRNDGHKLLIWDLDSGLSELATLNVPADSTIISIGIAPFTNWRTLIVQCTNSLYAFDIDPMLPNFAHAKQVSSIVLADGFPFVFDPGSSAPFTVEDVDSNRRLEVIIAAENQVYIVDYSGSNISPASMYLGESDGSGISSGAMAVDIDGDGKIETIGSFAFNRLAIWEDNFRMKRDYPVSFGARSRHLPFFAKGMDDEYYAWVATDNGNIYRKQIANYNPTKQLGSWTTEYANLARTASRDASIYDNLYQSTDVYVKSELYIYPNPLKCIYNQKILLSVMPSRDIETELCIYDIAGTLLYKKKALTRAYLRNLEVFDIPATKLSSGIYLAVIRGGGETHRIKFGVEK